MLQVRDTSIDLGEILLAMDTKNLGDVTVEGLIERVRQNGDTTEYNADAFKVNPDATAENLVEKNAWSGYSKWTSASTRRKCKAGSCRWA